MAPERPAGKGWMTRFATVLVATDGSDDGDAAVEAALDLAHDTGARVLVLAVVPEGSGGDEGGRIAASSTTDERADDALVREAAERVDGIVDHALEWGPEATPLIWEGDPAEAIVAASASAGADVIVIGTSGRGGVERMLLGSVSEGVARHAPCTVEIVRVPAERLAKAA